jgi:hypothetical protein
MMTVLLQTTNYNLSFIIIMVLHTCIKDECYKNSRLSKLFVVVHMDSCVGGRSSQFAVRGRN